MKKFLLGGIFIIFSGIAIANPTSTAPSPPITATPTVQLPPSDPNAGDASAYTSPDDGLTSPTENSESGREYQKQVEEEKIINPPSPPKPTPDQNSY